MLKEFPNVLILRIRMPFDDTLHPRSVITKVLKYSKVLDVQNSFTYLPDFLNAASALISKRCSGIYNIVNPGELSPYDIMKMYQEKIDPSHVIERLTLDDLSTVVKAGRSNCLLSIEKLKKEGISMLPVTDAVLQALRSIGEIKLS